MSTYSAFRHGAFVAIWAANTIALIGIAMFDAASGWLMTSLTPDPFLVSLVQTATMLPMALLMLLGGALADVVNPKRILVFNSAFIVALIAIFAATVVANIMTPATLLAAIFILSGAWALNASSWLAMIPNAVPQNDLDSAMAANGFGYNFSRVIGPAIGGFAIAYLGMSTPFWLFCGSNIIAIAALIAWGPPPQPPKGLPPERVSSAIRVGVRHALHNQPLRATLARTLGFFLFASAYLALLPLIARHALGRPEFYGTMLSVIALGCDFRLAGVRFPQPNIRSRWRGHLGNSGDVCGARSLWRFA